MTDTETLTFTTLADVRAVLAGHVDRFVTDNGFDTACRVVFDDAVAAPGGRYRISRAEADVIMARAVERGW